MTAHYDNNKMVDVTDKVTWELSSPGVIMHDVNATEAGSFETLATGSVNVTAIYKKFDASATITVTEAEVASLAVNSDDFSSFPAGRSIQVRAVGMMTDGTQSDITYSVKWTSSAPAVCTRYKINFLLKMPFRIGKDKKDHEARKSIFARIA